MYPIVVEGRVAEQHPGPFAGLRLDYDTAQHSSSRATHFALVVREHSSAVPCVISWVVDGTPINQPVCEEEVILRIESLVLNEPAR